MSAVSKPGQLHLPGEGDFTFPTAGGRVRLSVTDDALTPFGGLVPWAAYTKHIGTAEKLAADCPVKRTSPNAAPVYDILQSFMLTALTDGRRFSHVGARYPIASSWIGIRPCRPNTAIKKELKSATTAATSASATTPS